ncbi:cobalt ECF transporter T component CbiQ [Haloarcula nitratireducens]|uniref:Cobalt ECF transporter T component CbiQ n=1 Tax=Haloarcula nitratireducens TaxID=2487749 RepID=A0AAW4PBY7_9EURY|nr:cobalt ECF transporter T component CbiQ [Halomicroarcula nitratireducens]MBX0295233.1 cobalt ECF transporter T component CbiQ [Halomicroarcula nitratireducens]
MARTDLLDRTVAAIAARARWFLLAEDVPERSGFLQAVAPSVKLIGVVALVAFAVTRRDLQSVALLAGVAAALALLSRVPLRTFLGRATGPAAFAAVVVAPQAFLTGGPTFAGTPLSAAGVEYVAVFTVRVAACVAFLSVLLLTTRFADLLVALRRLRAPAIAVSLLAITYRYLLLFFAELERMVRARRGRTLADPDLRRTWRDSGNFVGTFLLRSLERGEGVQRAARARGGTGATPTRSHESLGAADAGFALVVLATVAGVGLA